MSEFVDLGEKLNAEVPSSSDRIFYPSFSISASDLGGSHEVGDSIEVTMKLKVVSADISLGEKKRFRLEIRELKK